jgi:glycosyltransferase involved in cell wall biosynthesis
MSDKPSVRVLHITPHFGGGVGTVLLGYLLHSTKTDPSLSHSVICLDYLNDPSKQILFQEGIPFKDRMYDTPGQICSQIEDADIVVVHWWNHPLLTDFLIRNPLPPCRLIIWCHITGSPAPNNLTPKILKYPDRFIFTTPVSYGDPEYKNLNESERQNVSAIWSTAGVERLQGIQLQAHEGFHVGYVGNLDPTKIHPDFIKLCKSINVPNVRFTVIGPINQSLVDQARDQNMLDKMTFTGYISEAEKWALLSTFDVFGYPLARHHYGSCDQTIQESMAMGIPSVVLNNSMESYMVDHGVTGLVLEDGDQYVRAIEELSQNDEKRRQLGANAKSFAFKAYSITESAVEWKKTFDQVLQLKKSSKTWINSKTYSITPAEIFIESLGNYGLPFLSHMSSFGHDRDRHAAILRQMGQDRNWTSSTKSTVHQFLQFFPNDSILKEWSELMQ